MAEKPLTYTQTVAKFNADQAARDRQGRISKVTVN